MRKLKKADSKAIFAYVRTMLLNRAKSYRWQRFEGDIRESFTFDTPDGVLHATFSPDEAPLSMWSVFFRFDGPRHKNNFHEICGLDDAKRAFAHHLFHLLPTNDGGANTDNA